MDEPSNLIIFFMYRQALMGSGISIIVFLQTDDGRDVHFDFSTNGWHKGEVKKALLTGPSSRQKD
jgi:hypothetical protein